MRDRPAPPSFSVVVCAYADERLGDLRAAVISALDQTLVPCEVIVAVDHNPGLLDRVRTGLSGVTAVPSTGPRGLSAARNSGVAAARGDVVAFLDDDAVAERDWLERLAAHYAFEDVLGVGGRIDPRWLAGRPRRLPPEFNWVCGCSYNGLPQAVAPVRNLIGANMSLRRDLVVAAGGFRPGIGRVGSRPVGCEETELCIRLTHLRPGGRFVYEPAARVRHAVPAGRTTWKYFTARCLAEGRSKATVAHHVGSGDALSAERAYVRRTLPRAVGRGLLDGLRGDAAGPLRSAWIVSGVACATAGYAAGTLRRCPA